MPTCGRRGRDPGRRRGPGPRLAAALADPAAGKAQAERAAAFVEARDAEARDGLSRIIDAESP
jgi:hypothetical protein